MNIKVPSVMMEFSRQFAQETLPTAKYIWKNYSTIITPSWQSLGVDKKIIVAFIMIESGRFDGSGSVNPKAVSPVGARGLMQLMPRTAYNAIEAQAPVMTGQQSAVIQRHLPGLIKMNGFVDSYEKWENNILEKLFDPEFNIWVGGMQLAQLMKYSIKKSGTLNLGQVVVMYNAGVGNYDKWVVKNALQKSDSTALIKGLQEAGGLKESRQYIVKLLGINGALVAASKVV